VIFEPIPANNGLLPQREAWIRLMVEEARKAGSLVIFDEVITGFRVAFGGMAERLQIKPDLVTYGKVIGGGFPVGAYGGRRDLLDLVAPSGPVYQAGTLSANPVAMRAGIAMLKKLKRTMPYSTLEKRVETLSRKLENEAKKAGIPLRVQNESSMFWTVFGNSPSLVRTISNIPAEHKERYVKGFHSMLDRGIYMAPSAFEVSFLSTEHTDQDLEYFTAQFAEVFKQS
jgi:glutamate-1-semialdehyde 2,1-aminomutase